MKEIDNLFLENKRLNKEEIRQKKSLLSSKFTSLICTLENKCNIQCIMCGVWRDPWSIPKKTFRQIIDILPYLEHVIWLGGEVFLSPYFGDLLEETKRYPYLEQRINTNGLLITEEWAEKLFQNNIELIYSIDGVTKETYEHIRRGGRFEDLLKSLNIIKEMRAKNKSKRFNLRLNVVVMKSNYQELERLMDFAKDYDFENVQLIGIQGEDSPEHIFNGKPESKEILRQLDMIVKRLQSKANEYNIELLNCLPLHNSTCQIQAKADCGHNERGDFNGEASFCYLPWQQMLIEPYGHVRFGCWCSVPIGNIMNEDIEEIWNSEVAQLYRQRIADNDYNRICDRRCLNGDIPKQLRFVDEFAKRYADKITNE
jgi:MoaA/NifB/PqqE/SkfB family radical SAM enzyme